MTEPVYPATTTAATRDVIEVLQAGRALAALAVVASHAAIAASGFAGPFHGAGLLEYGWLGVDFFFVLSGFIIFHSTVGRNKTAGHYAAARFRRVYLPYLPIGIAMALAYSFVPQLSEGHRDWSWLPTITLLPVAAETALSVAWTLKHEILFYAIFAAGYFSGRLGLVLGVWAVAIVVGTFAGLSDMVALDPINLEFLMGVIAAIIVRGGGGGNPAGSTSPGPRPLGHGSRWMRSVRCRRSSVWRLPAR